MSVQERKESKKPMDPYKAFRTGSWNSYYLEELDTSGKLTVKSLKKSLEIFSSKFKVQTEFKLHTDLLLWKMILEERKGKKKRMKTPRGEEETVSKPPRVILYKLGISMEDRILFSHKSLPVDMRRSLALAFKCKQLVMLDLSYSDPFNLLRFRRQSAKYNPGELTLQNEEHLAALSEEIVDCIFYAEEVLGEQKEMVAECHRKLGSNHDIIPCIKKINLNIHNQPLNTEVSGLSSYRLSKVVMEVNAPSVFHLYKELGETGHLKEVPVWLERARNSGKNTVTARFQ